MGKYTNLIDELDVDKDKIMKWIDSHQPDQQIEISNVLEELSETELELNEKLFCAYAIGEMTGVRYRRQVLKSMPGGKDE